MSDTPSEETKPYGGDPVDPYADTAAMPPAGTESAAPVGASAPVAPQGGPVSAVKAAGGAAAAVGTDQSLLDGIAKLKPYLEPPLGDWEIGGVTPTEGRLRGERISLRFGFRGGGQGLIVIGIYFTKSQVLAFKTAHLAKIPDDKLESSAKRMSREIDVQGQVEDDHLLPVEGTGSFNLSQPNVTVPYFLTRFVNGRSLQEKLKSWGGSPSAAVGATIPSTGPGSKGLGSLPQVEVVRVLRELAKALRPLHLRPQPICHRDIKPDNVLLEAGTRLRVSVSRTRGPTDAGANLTPLRASEQCESVILADLGLVRSELMEPTDLTKDGGTPGTPGYTAIERIQHPQKMPLPPSDIFSLGVVAYELLTGKHPFRHDWKPIFNRKVPKAPGKLNSRIAPVLSDLVVRMISHDEKKRPQTVDEIITILDSIVGDAMQRDLTQPIPANWPRMPEEWLPLLREAVARDFGFPTPWLDLLNAQSGRFLIRIGLLTVLRSLMTIREKFQSAYEKLILCCCDLEPTWRIVSGKSPAPPSTPLPDEISLQQTRTQTHKTILETIEKFFNETRPYCEVAQIPEFGEAYRMIVADLTLLAEETGPGIADVALPPIAVDDPSRLTTTSVEAPESASTVAILKTFDRLQTTINNLLKHQQKLVELQIRVKDYLMVELAGLSL